MIFKTPTEFVINRKYAFKYRGSLHYGVLVQSTNYGIRFKNVTGNGITYSSFVINRQNDFSFYELDSQKEKIQTAMENRALQIILRRLIDEYFM